MTSELKPCPFCGGTKALLLPYDEETRHFPLVRCLGCFIDVPGKNLDKSQNCRTAVERWNTRIKQAEAVPEGWRPIETAPRDGTPILVITARGIVSISAYDGCEWEVVADSNGNGLGIGGYPTHWMPLPNPPQPPAKRGA